MSFSGNKFSIGQSVICDPNFETLSHELKREWFMFFSEPGNERLIIGETYLIEDIDFHFPNKICVKLKGPHYFHSEFVSMEFFIDSIAIIRDKKIDQILN